MPNMTEILNNANRSNVQDRLIAEALRTERGRIALAAAMANPIRTELDYQGVGRKFFEVDVLAQGQLPIYDKDIQAVATVISKRGQAVRHVIEGDRVEVPTFEILAPAEIRLSEINQRRFNVIDRAQQKMRIEMQKTEDTNVFMLFERVIANNLTNNPITTSTGGLTKTGLNQLVSEIQKHDLTVRWLVMNIMSFKDLRTWGRDEFDPVTQREVLATGLYGSIWGADIIISRLVPDNTVYAITEPNLFGVMPIRTDVMVMPNDIPLEAKIGWVAYEEIGFSVVNPNGIAKLTIV